MTTPPNNLPEHGEQSSLQEHLQKDVPKNNKRTFTQLHEEDEEDAEDTTQSQGVSERTKKLIFQMWCDSPSADTTKFLSLLQQLENLSEFEAKHYLKCMEYERDAKVNASISKKIVTVLGDKLLHPEDIDGKESFSNDIKIQNDLSYWTGYCLNTAGIYATPCLILLYTGLSHFFHGIWKKKQKSSNNETQKHPFQTQATQDNSSSPPIPDGGNSEKPDGKDHVNGQVNNVEMDTRI